MTKTMKVLALALLALPVAAKAAETTTKWVPSSPDQNGATLWTSPAIASPTTATAPLKLKSCDANVKLYWKSSAAASTSVSILVGPSSGVSTSAISPSVLAVVAPTSTTLLGTGQCYVWGNIVPVAGATETTTFYAIEQSGSYRIGTNPSNR